MKDEFIEYFKSVGIDTEPLFERVKEIYQLISNFYPEEIVDVFVEEYIKKDGTREYEAINFFTKNLQISVDNFETENKIYVYNLEERLSYVVIDVKDYDFKKASKNSRWTLDTFNANNKGIWTFRASGENCDHLRKVFSNHFLNRLKT